MATYNGHENWNHWNVSLWINNDESLYRLARKECRWNDRAQAARNVLASLNAAGTTHTPDGAKYTITSIRAALVGM